MHQLARRLRKERAFAEVRVGFWKEDPHLHSAMDLIESHDVFVVPCLTSTGYFTESVIPRELGLTGRTTRRAGRTIRYCRPVGAHPAMEGFVLERAREVAPLDPADEARATLVVVGHGTEKHPGSGGTTRSLVERLQGRGRYRRVIAAFLDEEPRVEGLLDAFDDSYLILVPFFMSDGWHVGTTLPRALALSGGRTERGSTTIWYAQPVGTHPALTDVVRELVAEERARPGNATVPPVVEGAGATPADVTNARYEFLDWISQAGVGGRVFLQTAVRLCESSASGEPRFEVRHLADRDRDPSELRKFRDLEEAVELAALSNTGGHRPLKTAPDLVAGWRFAGLGPEGLWEVFTHLYPAAPVHRYLAAQGRLSVTPFEQVAARQSGIYAGIGRISAAEVGELVGVCCAREHCLRTPTWAGVGEDDDGEGPDVDRTPCPEPCSVLLGRAKETLDLAGRALDATRGRA
ncbi:MAG: hypothetical protein EXR92_02590 [Gemmatimonadetes bacterium]|nr:hypothetical protein [Gemmatimonadota bacterium]